MICSTPGRPSRSACLSIACFLVIVTFIFELASGQSSEQATVDFNRDIRPILSDRCFQCHGPDENSRETDLRLDLRESAEAFLEGDSIEEVELLQRVFTTDEDVVMPPPSSKIVLSEREKDLLRQWVKAGAPYAKHWAFELPQKTPLPKVKNEKWVQNEIDHFVLAKLEKAGISPNPKADKERLIRRVTFDLTGLPPKPEEIRNFVNDQSENAFEKVVDDLLTRQSYGERLTSDWLDVARYSDSFGYQVDRGRHVWPWRDWVIKAFNENMSYREFILNQLAGDLLPDASEKQILATAFNRLHPQKVEGGSVPEEFRVEYVADRTHTFGTAFLGLTLECARCHDHKYDPISQKEYYQLFAYFNNIDEAGLYSYFTNSTPTPTLLLTSDQQKKVLRDLQEKIEEKEKELASYQPDKKAFETELEAKGNSWIVKPIETVSFEDFKAGNNKLVPGIVGKGIQLTGDDAVGLKTGNFSRNQPFSISLWLKSPDVKERAVVLHRSRAWTDAGSRGYQILIEDGKLSASLIHFWPGNAIRVISLDTLPTNKWVHVGISYDGSSQADGLRIYVDGKPAKTETVRDNLYKNITGGGGDKIALGQRFRDNGFKDGCLDEVAIFDSELGPLEFGALFSSPGSVELKLTSLVADSKNASAELLTAYGKHIDKVAAKIRADLKSLRDQRSKSSDSAIEIMVMKEMSKRRPTFLLQRGAYDKRDQAVAPGLPAALIGQDSPKSRLGLAEWIVGDSNPLTARVTVNRYWQLIFGDGLVRTPEDFGSQGLPPTHARLLDWLAKDFQENDWNLKQLIKKMVMSTTYQQDSTLDPKVYQQDPDNLLLARAASFRLPAEMLRDNVLATSGLLNEQVGGAGAKPYDLALSFKPVGVDKGAGLYRRSVYTYWKRTGPSPVMMTLDASKRDVCTVKRERTATPLQAFVLLNDPQFVEAARILANNLLDTGSETESAIAIAFEKLTSRKPTEKEQRILTNLLNSQINYFKGQPDAANKYLAVGNSKVKSKQEAPVLAGLASVIQTIMNFDECVMRR